MNRSTSLSDVLHILLHMHELDRPVTSERLAGMLHTNPVVVRRTLSGLREHGLVVSEKGHGGGWRLNCDPAATTLYDVYASLGSPSLFAIGNRSAAPGCLVERAVNATMDDSLYAAEMLVLDRFRSVTLADLGAHFHDGMQGAEHAHAETS